MEDVIITVVHLNDFEKIWTLQAPKMRTFLIKKRYTDKVYFYNTCEPRSLWIKVKEDNQNIIDYIEEIGE